MRSASPAETRLISKSELVEGVEGSGGAEGRRGWGPESKRQSTPPPAGERGEGKAVEQRGDAVWSRAVVAYRKQTIWIETKRHKVTSAGMSTRVMSRRAFVAFPRPSDPTKVVGHPLKQHDHLLEELLRVSQVRDLTPPNGDALIDDVPLCMFSASKRSHPDTTTNTK